MITIGYDINRIKREFYEIQTNEILIEETRDGGKAELLVSFPSNNNVFYLRLLRETEPWLQYITNAKCADGIIIEIDDTMKDKARMFIFELKSTLPLDTWSKVLKQFRASILRGISVCSTIGISDVYEIRLFTACTDTTSIDDDKQLNQRLMRLKGGSIIDKRMVTGGKLNDLLQWREPSIQPFPDSIKFSHDIIKLSHVNGVNVGSYTVKE